jgi:hypothetical protein
MIAATDLRIGNWVQTPENDYFKVYQLGSSDVFAGNKTGVGHNAFFPIPLTPDILEKCGFEEVEGNEYYAFFDLEGVRVYIHKIDGSAFISYGYATLDAYTNNLHLHQLQNIIYALTNNEITINL